MNVLDSRKDKGASISLSMGTVSLFSLAIAHEYGFWQPFSVNFLEHVSLSDVPKLAVWPIVAVAGTMLLGMFTGMLAEHSAASKLPTGAGADTIPGRWLKRNRTWLGQIVILCGVAIFWANQENWYLIGPWFVSIGALIALDLDAPLRKLGIIVPEKFVFYWILFACLAFGIGRHEAIQIIEGRSFIAATFKDSGQVPLRYLGRAGDYMFFWNPDRKGTEMRAMSTIEPIDFTRGMPIRR